MIAFPSMLLKPAEKAGINTPQDADNFDPNAYPHFTVFLNMQLGQPMPILGCHWDNAKVVAAIPEAEIKTITPATLIERGFIVGYPIP